MTLSTSDVSNYSGIGIYAEHRDGQLNSIVPEIITAAHELKKELLKPIYAVLLGDKINHLAEELLSYGVDEIWVIDNPKITDFAEDLQATLLYKIIEEKKPEIFLGGGTVLGRSLFPRVAAKLHTGLTADCTQLSTEKTSKLLMQTRPTYGGNILASILCKAHRPQMATIRRKTMKAAKKVKSTGKIIRLDDLLVSDSKIIFGEFVKDTDNLLDISEANIIVAGGMGLKQAKNFVLIEKLAKVLGGSVGASRAIVDAGWVSYSKQIGQSGKIVNPQIYIACGISGSIQHLAGIKSSDIIIAINNDPDAPIFDIADFGIVGDLFEVIPEFIKQLSSCFMRSDKNNALN